MRTNETKWGPFRNEQEFLDFSRSYLSEAFPNPDRTGCPPDDALISMARRPLESDQSVTDHLMCCSPCFTAYIRHLALARADGIREHETRRAAWIRRCAISLAAAAILVIALYMFLSGRRTEPIIAPRKPAPTTAPDNSQAIYAPVVIDLSNASPTRGTDEGAVGSIGQVVLPPSRLDLSFRLPLGSEERVYSIALMSGQNILWSESVQARRQKGDTLLRVRADFTHVSAGNYDLRVNSVGRSLTVKVLIENSFPRHTEPNP